MARKGGLDSSAVSGFTARRGKAELQSSGLSTATQSTTDAGASRNKSFSEGAITRNQKEAEASTISSDGIHLARQSSIRRVVSLEPAPPPKKDIIYPVAAKVEQDQLVYDFQGNSKRTSKAPHTEKHLMSESSSSNSSHVIAPNHSENKSHLELSVETKPDGMVTGVCDRELKSSLSVDEKISETVKLASVGSACLMKGEFLKEIVKQLKSCDEQATPEASQLSEQLCSVKMKPSESVSPETRHESKEANHEEQQVSKVKVISDQDPRVYGFDLNEDFETNEVGNAAIDDSVSCHHRANVSEPIAVVARVGVPNGLPSVPLRFDGELGWRRSVATSAFRPTFPSNNSDLDKTVSYGKSTDSDSTPSMGPRGFDLNIAPPSEPHAVESSVELGLKVSERLTFNHNSDHDKYHARPNSRMLSFDLNDDNLLMDKNTSNGLHPPGLSSQLKRHYPPTDTMNGSARQGNVGGVRPAYWVDLSSMPGFTHVPGQQFLVAGPAPPLFPSSDQKQALLPLQSNMAFAPGPPSGYYIGTTNGLSSSMYSPNMFPQFGGQHGTSTTSPQISGHSFAACPGNLHLMEAAQGLTPGGGYTNMRPNFFLSGGVGSSENTNRVGNSAAEERMRLSQTVALPALAEKRKEPEGSWGSYQLNHRRMTTWK